MNITIYATKFTKRNTFGDFSYMIDANMDTDDNNEIALYIYNDNTESFNSHSYDRGCGNAVIRPYNQYNPNLSRPYSAGIPTGSFKYGGFDEFTNKEKLIIDTAINEIKKLITKHNINTLYYSTNDESGLLGQSIFEVNMDVRKYITTELAKLSNNSIEVKV